MSTIIWIVILIVALAAGIGAGYFIGYNNRKKTAEAQIGSAEAEATRLVNEAIKTAEQKRKEAVPEAKDEAFKLKAEVDAQKAEADKEIKQRRAEISRQENRIDQKETALDRKTEVLEKKEEELKKRAAEAEERLAEIDALRAKEMERLETLAGLSQEDAREVLLHKVDEELTHEKAVRVAAYETDLKENCDNIARNLIGQAVSRCAADHCSETTVSVVPLPSDEMKGRIIGREGRNIRALETATGVDLIIDDTPEAITLSSFDQTRREVARMTLERLIGDGRIHPARIEETVEKCRHELELQMKREGERAVMELGSPVELPPARLTIVEGAYSLHPYFGQYYDLAVFVTADLETRLNRIAARPGHNNVEMFRKRWIPMEERYLAAFEVEQRADLCIDTTC